MSRSAKVRLANRGLLTGAICTVIGARQQVQARNHQGPYLGELMFYSIGEIESQFCWCRSAHEPFSQHDHRQGVQAAVFGQVGMYGVAAVGAGLRMNRFKIRGLSLQAVMHFLQ